jgi:hypothetical protein
VDNLKSNKYLPAEPVSGFWKPSFNASNGYDLKNLGSTFPTGWGLGGTPN